ncbi:MAG: WYL domain-containing protein [Lachnospiraceae bacterium]|nr:WYL domain-containing protein [Lachnospiraceae bacterium]
MKKTNKEKTMGLYMQIWILYVLRTGSDKDHPLSIKEIAERITSMTGLGNKSMQEGNDNPVKKTVQRRLEEMVAFGYMYGTNQQCSEAYYKVLGGRVIEIEGVPKKYYFEPIMESGDVSMICAAIESNHYLSPEETEYLIGRESVALSYKEDELFLPYYRNRKKEIRLIDRPKEKDEKYILPSKASVTLNKIAKIRFALKEQLQIAVMPGTYIAKKGKTLFVPKSDKASVLNPYAFISQNGQYYLIATHEGYDNPVHYRVDRIYSIDLITGENNKYQKREDIPIKLQGFFKKGKFDADKYTATYPLMAYSEPHGTINCEFACLKSVLSIVIDHFGSGSTVKITDYKKDNNYSKVSVLADYNNVKMFCTQQYAVVTPLSPPDLKEDVKKQIQDSLLRMDKFV